MAKEVIAPAYGIAQETVLIVQWLKQTGDVVSKGEPIAEIETDKARVELEAPASGVLANITAAAGDDLPVGKVIATILSPEEAASGRAAPPSVPPASLPENTSAGKLPAPQASIPPASLPENTSAGKLPAPQAPVPPASVPGTAVAASPLAARMAAEHRLDLHLVKPSGGRVQQADVLDYLQQQALVAAETGRSAGFPTGKGEESAGAPRLMPASPKARRLAAEQGLALAAIKGSGPGGAVLAGDLLQASANGVPQALPATLSAQAATHEMTMSHVWRVMAERTTQSWTTIPHIFLAREVNASRLQAWREHLLKRSAAQITYTDLLVKLVAATLRQHPRLNAAWSAGKISLNDQIHIALAAATEDGLVVPVIHHADTLRLAEIAQQRKELVARAQARKLRPDDLRAGTFTISNLGMYGVDTFTALITPPQVAILAVGRIAPRIVPVQGQPGVQPTVMLSLACDHRAVDGARGAQFLLALAEVIEEPLGLFE